MNYHNITHNDMNNGDGIRVVLWVAGCDHHCPECQNSETWNPESGIPFDNAALEEICRELDKDYVSGITFSGGDPLFKGNRESIFNIMKFIKDRYPEKTIWLYTGYKYEYLLFWECTIDVVGILKMCDVVVDGRYDKNLRDTSLKWRGSKNQRVIDMQKSLETGRCVLHCD